MSGSGGKEGAANRPHPVTFLDKRRLETIKGYVLNEKRTPDGLLIATPEQTIGPFYPRALVAEGENDLTRRAPDAPRAEGEVIEIRGSVVDEEGRPVAGALIEIWQANTWGRYDHPVDRGDAPLDPNFRGFGRTIADDSGAYRFLTIKPGAYPNPGYDDWFRPPHVHFSVFGAGLMQRIITQMYFPGEPLNDIDPILNGVADLAARARLISTHDDGPAGPSEFPCYRFDLVLRGKAETPFFGS